MRPRRLHLHAVITAHSPVVRSAAMPWKVRPQPAKIADEGALTADEAQGRPPILMAGLRAVITQEAAPFRASSGTRTGSPRRRTPPRQSSS